MYHKRNHYPARSKNLLFSFFIDYSIVPSKTFFFLNDFIGGVSFGE